MQPSKKALKSVAGSLVAVLALTACSLGKPQPRPEAAQEAASFYVESAQAWITGTQLYPRISLPESKTVSFKACVRDSQYQKAIANHSFEISGGADSQTATTDNAGCLNWSEKFTYNHLARAQRIQIQRGLVAQGLQKGQRLTQWALNPWEDQVDSLLEKKISGLVPVEQANSALSAASEQALWIDDLRLTIDEKRITSEGSLIQIEIRTQPSFTLIKADGRRVLEPISQGKFEVTLTLISVLSENQKEIRRPISKPIQTQGQIVNNSLLLEAPVLIPQVSRLGQIQLGLQIKPTDAPATVGGFEGVFNIGEFDQIKGNFFARLKNVFQESGGALTLEKYLNEPTSPQAVIGTQSADLTRSATGAGGFQKSQVQIAPLEFSNVGFKSSKSLQREKVFAVTACLSTPIDGKPLRAQIFEVHKTNGQQESLRSNEKGCITWEDSVRFDYLQPECWMNKQARLQNKSFEMDQTLLIQMNPWSEGTSSLRDIRHVGRQELMCAQGKSKIVLFRYDFDKKVHHFPVDSYLNIKVQKEGIMKLQARVKRPSLTDASGFEDAALPPGRYLLRWAIADIAVKDPLTSPKHVYQVEEKWVNIDASGTFTENITLESADLKSIGNTSSLFLELLPENENPNLAVNTFRGPLVLANTFEGAGLEVFSEGTPSTIQQLKTVFQKSQKEQQDLNARLALKETLAQNENLQLLNLADENSTLAFRKSLVSKTAWSGSEHPALTREAVATNDLQDWLAKGQLTVLLARQLCDHWFYDQLRRPQASLAGKSFLGSETVTARQLSAQCRREVAKDPARFFDIHYRYFLKNARKTKDVSTEIRDVSFNHAFSLSQAHDESVSWTWSADVSGGFSTSKWMSPFSIAGGFRYQVSKATSDRTSSANSATIQSGESLMLEKLNLLIQAEGSEKCAVIRLNLDNLLQEGSPLKSAWPKNLSKEAASRELTRGILVCQGTIQERPLQFTESFFILNQRSNSAQVIDTSSDLGRPLFMAVRGVHDFRRMMHAFGGVLSTPDKARYREQIEQTETSRLIPTFTLGTPVYPGQYISGQ
jgi:hypothetical protein